MTFFALLHNMRVKFRSIPQNLRNRDCDSYNLSGDDYRYHEIARLNAVGQCRRAAVCDISRPAVAN